jgi:hypothetical protein
MFTGIKEYMRLGIPSTFMIVLDVWANCMASFVAGYLSVES